MVVPVEEPANLDALAVAGPELTLPAVPPASKPTARTMSRRVLGLAWPVITQNLLETLVGVIDTLLVSWLGAVAIAGVGAALQVVFFLLAVLSAVSIGAGIIVAHAIGAGDHAGAARLGKQTLVWGLLGALPLAAAGALGAGAIIRAFGVAPDVAAIGTGYLRITMVMLPALLLVFAASAVLRGAGDTKTPLRVSLLANLINAGLAYGLIYGHFGLPALGANGSAWAAATGRIVAAVTLVVVLARGGSGLSLRGRDGWWPRLAVARRILALGMPAALEQTLISAGFTTLTVIVATLGTQALAAQRIAFNAMSVAFLPGIGFSIAASTLVGQSLGARKPDEAAASAWAAAGWAALWMGAMGVVYLVFAEPVIALFTDDPAVGTLARQSLRVLALQQPLWGLLFVGSGALRGAGNTRFPLLANAIGVWGPVLGGLIAVHAFGASLPFVWAFFIPGALLNALANWRRFQRGDWRGHSLAGEAAA